MAEVNKYGHKGCAYESHITSEHAKPNVFKDGINKEITAFSGQTKNLSVEGSRTGNKD